MRTGALSLLSIICLLLPLPARAETTTSKVLITQVQLGGLGVGTAAQEYIELANATVVDADVTDWCVHYASASTSGLGSKLHCFSTTSVSDRLVLAAGGSLALATSEFKLQLPDVAVDATFTAGLSGTGGHLLLVRSDATVVDKVGWGTAQFAEGAAATVPPAGQTLQRQYEEQYVDTNNNASDFTSAVFSEPAASGLYEAVDVCLNNDVFPGFQAVLPDDYRADELGVCELAVQETCEGVVISEVLPNPAGVDAEREYIELLNTGDEPAVLSACELRIDGGLLTLDGSLEPSAYKLISTVTLPNTAGATVLIVSGDNEQSVTYPPGLEDDEAWANVDDKWVITNRPTPGELNLPPLADEPTISNVSGSSYTPCAPGKVRNPATNRCRTVQTASSLQSCLPGQYRNPETNRCRKVSGAVSSLQPCKVGQERNPATNRCRSIASVSALLKPCDEGEERNPETNRCRKIQQVAGATTADKEPPVASPNYHVVGFTLLGALSYGLFEYRQDLLQRISRLSGRIFRR